MNVRNIRTERRDGAQWSGMRRILSTAVAAIFAFGFLTAVSVSPAQAHGSVTSTTPIDASVLQSAPESVVIEFNEPITVASNAIRVVTGDGTDVAISAPSVVPNGGGATLTVGFTESVEPGWYAVSWRAISADGHPIASTFTFTYGAPAQADGKTAAAVLDDPSAPYRTASGVLRVLGYIVTLLAIGLLLATWPLAPVPQAADAARKAAAWAASAGLVITPLILFNNAVMLNGGTFDNLKTTTLIALQSNTGTALLVRVSALFGLCTAVLLVAEKGTRIVAAVIGAISAAGLAVSYAMAGHPSVVKWSFIAAPALVVHLLAGAAWLGGLPAVAYAFRRRSTLTDTDVARLVKRFSIVATISVVAVFIAGVVISVSMFSSPNQITGEYGISLLIKVGAVVLIAALGAYNHFVAVPNLVKAARRNDAAATDATGTDANGTETSGTDAQAGETANTDTDVASAGSTPAVNSSSLPARVHMGKLLKFEAFAVIVVAVLTGMVTNNAAPAAGGSHNAHQGVDAGHDGGGAIDVELQAALSDLEPRTVLAPLRDGELQVDYRPARSDRENLFTFTVTDGAGQPLAPQKISVSATHTASGVGPIVRDAISNNDGTFGWATRDLGIAGEWAFDVTVQLDAVTAATTKVVVTIRPPASQESAAPAVTPMPFTPDLGVGSTDATTEPAKANDPSTTDSNEGATR